MADSLLDSGAPAGTFDDIDTLAKDFVQKRGGPVDAAPLLSDPDQEPNPYAEMEEAAKRYSHALINQREQEADWDRQVTSYRAAHKDTPAEEQVEVLRYSAALGLPPSVVETQLPELRKKVDHKSLETALASRPQVAALLADVAKAPIVKDDAAALGLLEWGVTGKWEMVPTGFSVRPSKDSPERITLSVPEMTVGPGWARAFQHAVGEQKLVALSAKQVAGRTTPDEDKELDLLEEQYGEKDYGANNPVSKGLIGAFKLLPYLGGSIVSRGAGAVAGAVAGAGGGAAAGAETGPGAVVTGAAGGISGIALGEYAGGAAFDFYQNVGPQYRALKKLKAADGSPLLSDDEARDYALAASAVAAGLTSGFGGKMVKNLPGVKGMFAKIGNRALAQALEKPTTTLALKRFGTQYGQHLLFGGLMMASQAAANAGSLELAKGNHGEEASIDNVTEAMSSAFIHGIEDFTLIAALGPGREMVHDLGITGKVHSDNRRLATLLQAAKESKLLDRSPEEFSKFIDKAVAEGPDGKLDVNVPVDAWNAYWQSKKVDPAQKAAEVMGDEGKAYAEAVTTKGDLPIAMRDYLTKLGKTEDGDALLEDTRLSPDGRTARQEKLFQKEMKEKLEEQAKQRGSELDEGEKAVHEFIRDQATAADIPTKEAEAVAAQVAQYARTMAIRLNVDVSEAAALGSLAKLRILGPRGEKIAEATRRKFSEFVEPTGSKLLSERLGSMDAEARAREIYIDPVSGLHRDTVFDSQKVPDGKSVAVITSTSVKGINDHDTAGGHDVANDLLANMGATLFEDHKNAARGGTNFRILVDKGHEKEQLEAAIAKVKAALPEGIDLAGAFGKDVKEAHANLRAETDRRRALDPTHAEHLPERGKLREGFDVAALKLEKRKAKAEVPRELVSRVEGLSDKAFFEEAYLAKVYVTDKDGNRVAVDTGLLTRDGFYATPERAHTLSIDMKGLGKVPPEVGDEMLKVFSKIIAHFGGSSFDAARLSGDEFAAKGDDAAALEQFAQRIREKLKGKRLKYVDPATGKEAYVGIDFRHGIGTDYAQADRDLNRRRRAEDAGRADGSTGRTQDQVSGSGGRERGDDPRVRQANALGRGARPQAWPLRKQVAHVDGVAVQFAHARPGTWPEQFAAAQAVVRRMDPSNREKAQRWFAYTQDPSLERPYDVSPEMQRQLAKYGIVDPVTGGYDLQSQRKTLGGRKGPTKQYGAEAARAEDFVKNVVRGSGKGRKTNLYSEGRDDSGARGVITMQLDPKGSPVEFNVKILNGDRSTLAHETSHFLSWSLHEISESDLATPSIKRDYAALRTWAGYESTQARLDAAIERADLGKLQAEGKLTPEQEARFKHLSAKEERISHGWEQYLAEGKAPSKELRPVFTRFKGWMLRIYNGLSGIERQFQREYGESIGLSDEVRGVFDRLLAVENATAEGKARSKKKEFEPAKAAMTPKERRAYEKLREEAQLGADAKTNLRAAEIFRETVDQERARVRAEIAADVDKEPVYRAMRFLQQGELLGDDGAAVELPAFLKDENGNPLKLNRKTFVEQFGEDAAKDLPANMFERSKKRGIGVEDLATLMGFGDATEMVSILRIVHPREELIERDTQAKMNEIYAPALKQITETFMAAQHSDEALLATLMENRTMAQMVDPSAAERVRVTDLNTIYANAARLIEGLKVGEIDPAKYERQAAAAAEAREKLWAAGKKNDALAQADALLLNQALFRIASETKDALDRARDKMVNTSEATRATLGLADPSYRDVHDSIVEAVGLSDSHPDHERKTLDAMIERAKDDSMEIAFDATVIRRLLEEPRRWEQLGVEEAKTVADAITNLRQIARRTTEVDMYGRKVTKSEFFSDLRDRLARRAPLSKKAYSETEEAKSLLAGIAHLGRGADAILTNMETLVSMLDAHDREGPMHALLVDERLKARNREAELAAEVVKPIRDAWENIPKEIRKLRDQRVDVGDLLPVPEAGRNRYEPIHTRDQLWMLFLNWGNDGNRQRIRDGNRWTDSNVQAALSMLSKPELQFLQTTLDTINSLYPEIARVHEGRTGLELDKVDATPIVINGEQYAGGYFPIKYDFRFTKQGEWQEGSIAAVANAPNYVTPYTPRGHTKERLEKVFAPVGLDWSTVPAHLTQVIHDVAYGDWVRQVAGILLDERFKDLAKQYIGEERFAEFMPWLKDVSLARADSASGQHSEFQKDLGSFARSRVAAAALAHNLPVLLQNLTDPWNAATQEGVKPHHMAKAYLKLLNPMNWGKLPELALSKEIGYREVSLRDNLRTAFAEIGPRGHGLGEFLQETNFALYELMDKFSTRLTFKAAFDDAKSAGMDDAAAAKRADDVLRRMFVSHDIAEKAGILRNKQGIGALIVFYSWSNRNFNALRRRADRLGQVFGDEHATAGKKGLEAAKMAGALIALGVIGAAGRYAFAGRGPPKDEDKLEWLLTTVLLEDVNTVPFVGALTESLLLGRKPNIKAAPEISFAADIVGSIGDAAKKAKEGKAADAVLAAATVLIAGIGGPAGQFNRTSSEVKALATGEAAGQTTGDVISGLIYGNRGDKQPTNLLTDLTGRKKTSTR